MTIKVGDRLPDVKLVKATENGPEAVQSGDYFTMLADGNGDFAEAVGLTMDGSGFGLGKRGQRWSAIVEDGVVKELNVEAPGDFSVSSAEHMLGQL